MPRRFLVSMCISSSGVSCSWRTTGSTGSRSPILGRPTRGNTRPQRAPTVPLDDQQGLGQINGVHGARESIGQGWRAASQLAAQPLHGSRRCRAMFGGRFTGTETVLCHLTDHLQAAGEGKSGMLVGVHPFGFHEGSVFSDFQSLDSNPDGQRIRPVEASPLAIFLPSQGAVVLFRPDGLSRSGRNWICCMAGAAMGVAW